MESQRYRRSETFRPSLRETPFQRKSSPYKVASFLFAGNFRCARCYVGNEEMAEQIYRTARLILRKNPSFVLARSHTKSS